MTGKRKLGRISVIKRYFGILPAGKLSGFRQEISNLSEDEKTELAVGAARNLKLTQREVDFNIE